MKPENIELKMTPKELTILRGLQDSPVSVDNLELTPKKTRSFIYRYYLDEFSTDVSSTIESLKNKNLIRISTTEEEIPFLSSAELKQLIKNFNGKLSGTKSELIIELNKFVNDSNFPDLQRRFYVVTNSGIQLINKYKNFYWFSRHEYAIFGDNAATNKFNKKYFIKSPNNDPSEIMIEELHNSDFQATSVLYRLRGDYENALDYGLKCVVYLMNQKLSGLLKDPSYFWLVQFANPPLVLFELILKEFDFNSDKREIIYKELYDNSFKYPEIFDFTLFKQFLNYRLGYYSEIGLNSKSALEEKIQKKVNEAYSKLNNVDLETGEPLDKPKEGNSQISIDINNQYSLLSLLIDHLDSDLLINLKKQIDNRLNQK